MLKDADEVFSVILVTGTGCTECLHPWNCDRDSLLVTVQRMLSLAGAGTPIESRAQSRQSACVPESEQVGIPALFCQTHSVPGREIFSSFQVQDKPTKQTLTGFSETKLRS